MRAFVACVLLTLAAAGAAGERDGPAQRAEALFERHCADCHAAGDGHPGTMRLAARLGAPKSVLTARTDLPAAYVEQVIRHGLQMMPPFRATEISDADVATLAAWVAGTGANAAHR